VQRLSEERVHELAEEIWTSSTETTAPARRDLDPRHPRRGSSPRRRYSVTTGLLRQLRWQAAAFTGALAGDPTIPVRPLLCVYPGRWSRGRRPVEGVATATSRQLGNLLHHASSQPSKDVERATERLLDMVRPAT